MHDSVGQTHVPRAATHNSCCKQAISANLMTLPQLFSQRTRLLHSIYGLIALFQYI